MTGGERKQLQFEEIPTYLKLALEYRNSEVDSQVCPR